MVCWTKQFTILTVRPTDHIMQAERHLLSKETPQNFQHLREVVETIYIMAHVLLSFT